jgi:hypothetical protein
VAFGATLSGSMPRTSSHSSWNGPRMTDPYRVGILREDSRVDYVNQCLSSYEAHSRGFIWATCCRETYECHFSRYRASEIHVECLLWHRLISVLFLKHRKQMKQMLRYQAMIGASHRDTSFPRGAVRWRPIRRPACQCYVLVYRQSIPCLMLEFLHTANIEGKLFRVAG